jgi:hypothetical protein
MAESAAPSPGRIFISYRREETAYPAGWLYDRLADRYGGGQVFKDVDSIQLGDDFVEVITRAVGSCDVLLALVGDQWLTITDTHGRRRLDDPDDFVRLEIEAALTRNVRVIPILVDAARMPNADELPASLAKLVRRQALELSPARFDFDTSRLLKVLDKTLAEVRTAHDDAPPTKAPAGVLTSLPSPSRAPAVPTGLSGSSTAGRVDLHWDPAVIGSFGVVRWEVFRDGALITEATSPRASDVPPRPGSYRYTVLAVGEDTRRSAQSVSWTAEVRPGRWPRWLIPALAIMATVVATAGLILWAPWRPDATDPPVPPAGLTGNVSGTKIDLRWDSAPADSAAVARWELRRDGAVVAEATEPQAVDTVPSPGFYSYTLVAVGEDGQRSAESDSWNSPPEWQKLDAGFQENFSAAGVANHKGELWVVGGARPGDLPRDEVRIFNPQTGAWRDGPRLPEAVQHAALVSAGEQLFLLGGLTRADPDDLESPLSSLRTVYRLDSPNGTWMVDAPLPEPRLAGAAAWDGHRLVFAGGAEQMRPRQASADIWELESGQWVTVGEQLRRSREHLAAVTDGDGTIWFVGGADVGRGTVIDDIDVLRGNTLDASPAISTAVEGAATIWTSGMGVCVFGGSTTLPNAVPAPVDLVDCPGGSEPDLDWPLLPEPRAGAVAAVIGDTVYVVGGYPALEAPDMVLALRFG